MTKKTKINLIAMSILIVLGIAIFILIQNESIAELISVNWCFLWAKVFGAITGWIPFNVFEVLAFIYACILLVMLILIIYDYVHKNKDRANQNLTGIILSIITICLVYVSTAGTMYYRKEVNIEKVDYLVSNDEAKELAGKYFGDLNALASMQDIDEQGYSICHHSDEEIISLIRTEYDKLDPNYFSPYTAMPKKVASSYMMSAFGIMGITFIPTVEAGYNTQMLQMDKVVTIAHELAHTKGVMRENEANLTAYYVLMNSSDSYLKYVGYLFVIDYMSDVFTLTNNQQLLEEMDFESNIINDISRRNNWWDQRDIMENVGDFFNNIYLKANGQSEGVSTYYATSNYEAYFDETEQQWRYVVNSFSSIQNMVFGIYV